MPAPCRWLLRSLRPWRSGELKARRCVRVPPPEAREASHPVSRWSQQTTAEMNEAANRGGLYLFMSRTAARYPVLVASSHLTPTDRPLAVLDQPLSPLTQRKFWGLWLPAQT